jgi:hypothetical protein
VAIVGCGGQLVYHKDSELLAMTACGSPGGVPGSRRHHRSLPVHSGIAGLGSAVGALTLLGFRLRALTALGMRLGGWTLRLAGLLAGPVSLALWIWGPASWAAAAFLAGAVAGRYGWL